MASRKSSSDAALAELRAFGLAFPGAHTKSPWPGHLDLAWNDKTFAYLSVDGAPFSISCKLPGSAEVALMVPHTAPTGYGLGKSGWVTATPPPGTPIAIDLFKAWILESFRAQAPKRLVAQLEGAPVPEKKAKVAKKAKKAKKTQAAPAKKRIG